MPLVLIAGLLTLAGALFAPRDLRAHPCPACPVCPGAQPGDDAEDVLARVRNRTGEQWAVINAQDPRPPEGMDPAQFEKLKQLEALFQNPVLQRYVSLLNRPGLLDGVRSIAEHPARWTLLYAELAWLAAFIVFRIVMGSRPMPWPRRLAITLGGFAAMWVGVVLLIPFAVLGNPWLNTVRTVISGPSEAPVVAPPSPEGKSS